MEFTELQMAGLMATLQTESNKHLQMEKNLT